MVTESMIADRDSELKAANGNTGDNMKGATEISTDKIDASGEKVDGLGRE